MEKEKRHAFGKDIFLLGADENGTKYWLEEASWDCDWYWGFGYVETYTNNENPETSRDIESHQHFDGLFLAGDLFHSFKKLLITTPLSDDEIWKLLELMQTFYKLKESAEVFGRGGSHITTSPIQEKLQNKEYEESINKNIIPEITKAVYKILSPEAEV